MKIDQLFRIERDHEHRRTHAPQRVGRQTVEAPIPDPGPPTQEHVEALDALAKGIADADPADIPQHHLAPYAEILDAHRTWPDTAENFPPNLLWALDVRDKAEPRKPLPVETVESIVSLPGMSDEQSAKMLNVTRQFVVDARDALRKRRDKEKYNRKALELPRGHKTSAMLGRAEIEAAEREQFTKAQGAWREHQRQQVKQADAAEWKAPPESVEELLGQDVSVEQVSRMWRRPIEEIEQIKASMEAANA